MASRCVPRVAAAAVALPLLLLCNGPPAIVAKNMNGEPGQYKIANALPDKTYSTDYDAEYFDVYSPVIRTRYSEVYWRMQDAVPLPDAIRERFAGKVMAVVGYEVDQVRKSASGDDLPVPITYAYNHHYMAWLLNSKKARLVKRQANEEAVRMGLNHGGAEHWTPEMIIDDDQQQQAEDASDGSNSDMPSNQFFSEGNGGEFRMSYHGYPKGYAQLIESPDTFQLNPMQIDTWNRDEMKMTDAETDSRYAPGPLPKNSRIPPSAGYSGLIECPCSDRLPKKWAMTYALDEESSGAASSSSSCKGPIRNASECFAAARLVAQAGKYTEHDDGGGSDDDGSPAEARAGQCTVEPHADGSADIFWKADASASSAGNDDLSNEEQNSGAVVAFSHAQVNLTVSLAKEDAPDAATITIVGPSDRWFGIGFGSDSMCIHMEADECPDGGPYAIVVAGDGQEGVTERKLDYHGVGTVLPRSVTVQSSVVDENGNRTVVLTRPLAGATADHYTFDPSAAATSKVPIIAARGCDLTFAQHCGHGPSELNFLSVDVPTGICQAGVRGTIGGNNFNENRCAAFPTSDLSTQDNPTCSVQTYCGGLTCCRDGSSLLDADEDIPWPDHYLEYYLKFRFYFEEYQATTPTPSHQNLVRLYWQTEAFAGEYDVVQCLDGTPPSQCIQVITSRFRVRDMIRPDETKTEGVELIYAGPHCHAPTCLSMELYDADTGRLLCHAEPIHGQSDEVYDERGFLAIPPCLWGDADEGLTSPVLLSLDTTLLSIKRNNNTLGHTGEMASWQMRGVVVPRKEVSAESPKPLPLDFVGPQDETERRGQVRRRDDTRI